MFRKKTIEGEACTSCDRRLSSGQKVCDCGTATRYMSFDERREWEVEQWRKSRGSIAAQA